jgi:hypothetical protein
VICTHIPASRFRLVASPPRPTKMHRQMNTLPLVPCRRTLEVLETLLSSLEAPLRKDPHSRHLQHTETFPFPCLAPATRQAIQCCPVIVATPPCHQAGHLHFHFDQWNLTSATFKPLLALFCETRLRPITQLTSCSLRISNTFQALFTPTTDSLLLTVSS